MKTVPVVFLVLVAGCASPQKQVADPAPALSQKVDYLEEWNWRQEEEIKQLKQQVAELRGEYLLQPGDTLSKVAAKFGLRVDELIALNPDIQPAKLKVGQRVKLKKEPNQ